MTLHVPVMLEETLDFYRQNLALRDDLLFIDATLGAGGHAGAVLEAFPGSRVIGFDQDATARHMATERLSRFGERLLVVGENFRAMRMLLEEPSFAGADGILFDLGVSNMQLTLPERGFSYQESGPLDMRMNNEGDSETAESLINGSDIRTLTKIFREYGEERHAYVIARGIVRARERGQVISTTEDLSSLIRQILPAALQRKAGGHPARRVFQGLRIAVNGELDALDEGLDAALAVARPGAVIIVMSYHSLEDRMVKRRFLSWAGDERGSILSRRPLTPTEEETEENRSARSAKMRAFLVRNSAQPGAAPEESKRGYRR